MLAGQDDGDDVDRPVLVHAVPAPGARRSSATRSSGPERAVVRREHDACSSPVTATASAGAAGQRRPPAGQPAEQRSATASDQATPSDQPPTTSVR